jgi:L-rhamnose mutarotase
MPTRAFRMVLKPGMKAEYERRHAEIWPELVAELRRAGVTDYRIFLDEQTNHLFAVLEHRPEHDLDALPTRAVVRRWWDSMAELMRTAPDNTPEQTPLVPMFHMP